MKCQYESEILYKLMERDGFNIPSSVPPYEAEIKSYLINQVKQAYPKLTDYEAEWLLYNYTKHLPAEFPIRSVSDATEASFENVVPFAYKSAILKGCTGYRDIDTSEILETFEEGRNLELVSVKMPVLSTTGKNLLDVESVFKVDGNTVKEAKDGSVVLYKPSRNSFIFGTIKVKANTTYTISCEIEKIIDGGRPVYGLGGVTENKTAISDSNGNLVLFMRAGEQTMESEVKFYNIQLEEGSTATSYETHKTNILTVNEDVTLRGIGDVQDTMDCLTGEVVQRVGEIILNGDENWNVDTELTNNYRFYLKINDMVSRNWTTVSNKPPFVKSNTFRSIDLRTEAHDLDTEHLTGWDLSRIILNISKERLSEFSVGALKSWLSQNPITVQYELATESIKTVDLTVVNEKGESVYFMPLEGTMNVQSSGEIIQPTFDMSVPVEATTQNLASFIELEME